MSNRYEVMEKVRDGLYADGDMPRLAERVGVTPGTLYAIRSGRTKWPRHKTLFALLPHLGLELMVIRIGSNR